MTVASVPVHFTPVPYHSQSPESTCMPPAQAGLGMKAAEILVSNRNVSSVSFMLMR